MLTTHCTVRKQKYDGSIKSEWEGDLLDSAESNWLKVLHHPQRHKKYTHGKPALADKLFVHYFSTTLPLAILVQYDDAGRFVEAKFDAALPATIENNIITFVDLDLDIVLAADFSWYLQDEAEFEQHRATMGYSDEVVQLAWEGINSAEKLIADKTFPFTTMHRYNSANLKSS